MTKASLSPRRRRILDAATVVVADHGLRGLTHRAVDREAGLPEGSCSAYFRTRLTELKVDVQLNRRVAADELKGYDHVVVATDGLPLGAVPSAANVHDTRLFRHLLRLARVAARRGSAGESSSTRRPSAIS